MRRYVVFVSLGLNLFAGTGLADNTSAWLKIETENFRLYHQGDDRARAAARALEARRGTLQGRWAKQCQNCWTPKCDVIWYPDATAFKRGTGRPPEMMGVSDLEIGDGRVWRRRISLRADLGTESLDVLNHELVHVILADCFCQYQIAPWLDEGIATFEENSPRKTDLDRLFAEALSSRRHLPLSEIVKSPEFPYDQMRADLLYAQSASFVAYLLTRARPESVLKLGNESASLPTILRDDFGFASINEAERAWHDWLRSTQKPETIEASALPRRSAVR